MTRRLSFRARILLLVLGVGLLPLVLVGWWITGTAARSGEEVLRERLRDAMDAAAADFGRRWLPLRSRLLDLAEEEDAWEAAPSSGVQRAEAHVPDFVRRHFADLPELVAAVTLLDSESDTIWSLWRETRDSRLAPATFVASVPVYTVVSAHLLGTIEARIHADALLPDPRASFLPGAVLGAVDRRTGASLIPVPMTASKLRSSRFTLVEDEWLAERRPLSEVPVDLVAAAPITPFTEPFRAASREGLWILLMAAAGGLALAVWLTGQMTRSLAGLVRGADTVARGDLSWRVADASDDELGRVAQAFNTMAESLDETLSELAQRESLAAVGEFASELAHEVRNPLTAIRVNLQVVEERLEPGSRAHDAQRAAIEEVNRLERTVSGALQLARSGRVAADPTDLRVPLEAALGAAGPVLGRHGVRLAVSVPDTPVRVRGDSDALQQMLLNLVVNAAQASRPGGVVEVSAEARNGSAAVAIRDGGRGMPPEVLARVREPFYSTRPQGTGLGLGIADRIARAHGAELVIESREGAGTTVEVRLPLDGWA